VTPTPILDVSLDADDLADRVAIWIATRIAIAKAPFGLCLAGGSTPKKLYELLASEAFVTHVDWSKLQLFFGDERFVPFDSPLSNFKMAREAWLSHVPLAAEQIHPIPTDAASPQLAAAQYQAELQRFYGSKEFDGERPLFDVTLLGLGPDGHTASLFPGTAALEEKHAWVTSIIGAKEEPRISLTYPALESSASIVFLVSGQEKKTILERLLKGDLSLPAARLNTQGKIFIFADRAAVQD
jgi:6-phosphogluconolactonase